jgi:hypothetical protein
MPDEFDRLREATIGGPPLIDVKVSDEGNILLHFLAAANEAVANGDPSKFSQVVVAYEARVAQLKSLPSASLKDVTEDPAKFARESEQHRNAFKALLRPFTEDEAPKDTLPGARYIRASATALIKRSVELKLDVAEPLASISLKQFLRSTGPG